MRAFCSKKSQSLAEYAFILLIVGAALIGMFTYMRRSIQAVVKVSADQLGPQQVTKQSTSASTTTDAASRSLASRTTRLRELLGGIQIKLLNSAERIYSSTHSTWTTTN